MKKDEHFYQVGAVTHKIIFAANIHVGSVQPFSVLEKEVKDLASEKPECVILGGATEEIIQILTDKTGFESYMYSSYGHAAFDTAPDYKEKLLTFCNK